jgi:dUTP pyrophosphatase
MYGFVGAGTAPAVAKISAAEGKRRVRVIGVMPDAIPLLQREARPSPHPRWVGVRQVGTNYIGPMPLIVELLHPDAQPPRRATEGSAGYDLCAYLIGRTVKCSDGQQTWNASVADTDQKPVFSLQPAAAALIPLGFKARLPHGIEAQIRPRSGTSFKKGLQIPNAPGTIDSDYPDEWMVIVRNPTASPIAIEHGERIAQMVLARYEVLDVEEGVVGVITSRVGGFGSTGQ